MSRRTSFPAPSAGLGLALLVLAAGCGREGAPVADAPQDPEGGGHGHHHTAPHGGCLVVLGDELAHVELVLDGTRGEVTAYVLGGHAVESVRIAAPSLTLRIEGRSGGTDVALSAVASALTGETVGDTSEFRGIHESLKGVDSFEAQIARIEVRGQLFEDVAVTYPEGNE